MCQPQRVILPWLVDGNGSPWEPDGFLQADMVSLARENDLGEGSKKKKNEFLSASMCLPLPRLTLIQSAK